MIDGLRPYAEMRPSGLPWLGDVPAHWDVRRIKTLLREVDNRTKTGEERLLSLRMRQGLVDHIDAGGKLIPPESLVNFKIVEPGQVVMNRMRAAAGLFGVASVRGLVSPDYAVFEPKPEAFNPYLLQAFRLPSLSAVFRAESKGLGTGQSGFLRLYTDRFGPIPVPYPPLDEQRLIVRFLDWHGVQTAKLIRAKKKIIALLNEQKQAIIHRAVTRGLDADVRLKPSGIPWLGDVPERWEIRRGKSLFTKVAREVSPDAEVVTCFRDGTVTLRRNRRTSGFTESLKEIGYQGICRGDLVIHAMDAFAGAIGVSDSDGKGTPVYSVCRPENGVNAEYFALLLREMARTNWLVAIAKGIRERSTDFRYDAFAAQHYPAPPFAEQCSIVAFAIAQTTDISRTIEQTLREITLVDEFRTRLIADVVTGKLDVRAIAASLPETSEAEPIDDLAEDDDLDEAVDDAENEEVAA